MRARYQDVAFYGALPRIRNFLLTFLAFVAAGEVFTGGFNEVVGRIGKRLGEC
jgi:hypothetical protein